MFYRYSIYVISYYNNNSLYFINYNVNNSQSLFYLAQPEDFENRLGKCYIMSYEHMLIIRGVEWQDRLNADV
jgi:hypothetical protein